LYKLKIREKGKRKKEEARRRREGRSKNKFDSPV
jgi:hypothetical protein